MEASCADRIFQKLDETSGAIRHIFRTYDIDHIRRHSPPVVHCFLAFHRFNLICTLKGKADDLLIKFTPVPYRHCQVLYSTIIFLQIQPILSGWMIRIYHIMAGNIMDSLFMQNIFCMFILLSSCPLQMDFHIWIDHSCPQCKGINICQHTISWLFCNVTQFILSGQRSCNGSHQEFGFIHPCIIVAHRRIGHIDRTIIKFNIRIHGCRTDTLIQHSGSNGKNDGTTGFYFFFNRFSNLFLCLYMIYHHRSDLSLKRLLQIHSSQFMSIDPTGRFRRSSIDKTYF